MAARVKSRHSLAWRIITWNVVIVLLALGSVLYLTDTVRRAQISTAANHDVEQEISQFTEFAAGDIDPATGAPFSSPQELIESYLRQQVPKPGEVMVGVVSDRIIRQSLPGSDSAEVLPDSLLRDITESATNTGVLTPPGHGSVHWARTNLHSNSPSADASSFIIAVDTTSQHHVVSRETRLFSLMALGIALISGILAWSIAQRIVRPIRKLSAVSADISDTNLTRRVPVHGADEIAQLARRFNQMLNRLDIAYRAQRTFLDDAGHELRTPITVVRGHLEMLPTSTPEQQARSLDLCVSELDRMSRMVDELIALAVTENEKFLQQHEVDLTDWFISVEDKADALSEGRTFATEIPQGTAFIDADRLTEALLELVTNAHKYSTRPIELAGRVDDSTQPAQLILTVTDYGPGIPADIQDTIFERFHRGDVEASTGASSGLGLAIVKSIAENHGGHVWVHSTPPNGATFGLTLPLRKEPTK